MQNSYSNRQDYEFAGFWVRFAAYLIDYVIVFAGLLIVRIFIALVFAKTNFWDSAILFQFSLKDIMLYLLSVLYFILLTYYTGTTVGKRVMNLRVISACENEQPTLLDIIYRETVGKFLSGLFLSVGYILAGLDKEKRALHDILCDTRVIYAKKVKVYPVFQNPVPPAPWHAPVMPPNYSGYSNNNGYTEHMGNAGNTRNAGPSGAGNTAYNHYVQYNTTANQTDDNANMSAGNVMNNADDNPNEFDK